MTTEKYLNSLSPTARLKYHLSEIVTLCPRELELKLEGLPEKKRVPFINAIKDGIHGLAEVKRKEADERGNGQEGDRSSSRAA